MSSEIIMTDFTQVFPFKNCNDNIIVCDRCENVICILDKLVNILSFINLKKTVFDIKNNNIKRASL